MRKDIRKDAKVNKGKTKTGDEQKNVDGVKSTLEKMLTDPAGSVAVASDGGLEEDDMLSVVKRRRQLAAKAAEEKKIREEQ